MSGKIKIVADANVPFLKGALEPYAVVEYYRGSEIDNEKVKDADALIIRTRTQCNSALLNNTNVKLITTATIGFDHIDTEYCRDNNIKWVNAPGCNSSSVMQYVASALMVMAKEMNFILSEKTIGIIGVGNVGSKVAKLCRTIGMKILLNDPPRQRREGDKGFVSVEEILRSSDIITFHVPLTKYGEDKTYHMADEDFFSKLRPGTVLFNTSRGSVVSSSALKQAIISETVPWTVLDVWEHEPEPDLQLLRLVNIATPHIAGYSADGKANGTAVCVNAVNDYFKLGMSESWYPPDIPLPINNPVIEDDCSEKTNNQILSDILLHTYNISHFFTDFSPESKIIQLTN